MNSVPTAPKGSTADGSILWEILQLLVSGWSIPAPASNTG